MISVKSFYYPQKPVSFGMYYPSSVQNTYGTISKSSSDNLNTLISAYKEIYRKIGILSENELKNISKEIKGVEFLGKDKGIVFHNIDDTPFDFVLSMPDFSKYGDSVSISVQKNGRVLSSISSNRGQVFLNGRKDCLKQSDIMALSIDKKIELYTEMLDYPLLKVRKFIANNSKIDEMVKLANEKMILSRKFQALSSSANLKSAESLNDKSFESANLKVLKPKYQTNNSSETAKTLHCKSNDVSENKNIVKYSKPKSKCKKVITTSLDAANTDKIEKNKNNKNRQKTQKSNDKLLKIKSDKKKQHTVNKSHSDMPKKQVEHVKTIKPEDIDYSNSLITPAEAFESAQAIQEHLRKFNNKMDKYSSPVKDTIRKAYDNYYYKFADTVAEFKNVGDEKLILAFRYGCKARTRGFYNIGVFDKDNNLIKAYVVCNEKIVDSTNISGGYPIRSFIPKTHILVDKSEQEEFLKYLKMVDEQISKFEVFLDNKGWHKK